MASTETAALTKFDQGLLQDPAEQGALGCRAHMAVMVAQQPGVPLVKRLTPKAAQVRLSACF